MAQLAMSHPDAPEPEDEGLTLQEIHWIPM